MPPTPLTPFAYRLQRQHDRRRAQARAQLLYGLITLLLPYVIATVAILLWGLLNGLIERMH